MSSEIRITAHIAPAAPNSCKFTVDRPVYEGGSVYFWSKGNAGDSALAKKLFALDGVTAVRIAGHDVVITRGTPEDWKAFASQAAAVIRGQLECGAPAVSSDYRRDPKAEAELKNKVQMIFDTDINPAVASHGGRVDLIDVKDNNIYLKMGGGCQGCGGATATLRQGIEGAIRDQLPEIDAILDVTDHAQGANPYYQQDEH